MNRNDISEQTFDFAGFYDALDSYTYRRIHNSASRLRYLNEIDHWKAKYLVRCLPAKAIFDTVLEIGCATGDLVGRFPISTPPSQRHGIDISPLNIAFAQSVYPEIHFHTGSFESFLDTVDEGFEVDLIILSDILEHVEDDVALLSLAASRAKYVLVNVPLEKCWRNWKRTYGPSDLAGHLRSYNLQDTRALIANAGLREVTSMTKYWCRQWIWWHHRRVEIVNSFRNPCTASTRQLLRCLALSCVATVPCRWYTPRNFFALLRK